MPWNHSMAPQRVGLDPIFRFQDKLRPKKIRKFWEGVFNSCVEKFVENPVTRSLKA